MPEQRKHHRVPVVLGVVCIPADGGEPLVAAVKDISVGGMFIESEKQLPFGSTVTLVLNGMAARELRVPGIVRWSEKHGFGVQFGLLGAYATHAIVNLVKKNSS